MHFVKLNQFILIMHILNQNIEFQLSGEKNIVDIRGLSGVLVSDSIEDINKVELLLGKLPEFTPEYVRNYHRFNYILIRCLLRTQLLVREVLKCLQMYQGCQGLMEASKLKFRQQLWEDQTLRLK